MNITLRPETEKRISEKIRRGEFVNADAIVEQAVTFFLNYEGEEMDGAEFREVKAAVAEGLQQAERCEAVEQLSKPDHQIRKLLYGRKPHTYRVYFDVAGTTVRILHIRHGARQEPGARERNG